MVAAPTARTWVDGEIPPADTLNSGIYDVWNFLLNPPMVRLRQVTAQTIPNNTYTAITWDTEDVDTHGFHSTTTNPTRITPTVPGYYVGAYGATFSANTTGRRIVTLRKNGAQVFVMSSSPSNVSDTVIKGLPFGPVFMNGTTDYFDVAAYQISGVSLSTVVGAGTTDYEQNSEFYCRWWSS